MRRTWVLTMFISVAGCGGKAATDATPSGAKPAVEAKFDSAGGKSDAANSNADAPSADPTAAPADTKAVPADPTAEPTDAKADALDRGARFVDPPWFRKTLFADAVNTDFKRSQVDDKGLFSSQILFDLADGTTMEGCAKHLEDKLGSVVTNLKREDGAERITIRGETERYTVTLLCGEAKGVMKAYVSFAWTN